MKIFPTFAKKDVVFLNMEHSTCFHHRFIVFTVLAFTFFVGCSHNETSSVERAIAKAATETIVGSKRDLKSEDVVVTFKSITQIDSSTVSDEIERRRDIFQLKMERQSILESRYTEKKMKTNARRQHVRMEQSAKIIAGLDSIAFILDPRRNEILHRTYLIEGQAETPKEIISLDGFYVVLTSDEEVVAFTKDKKSLYRGTGRLIPGYMEMLSRMDEELMAAEKADSLQRERRKKQPYYYWEDEVW